MFRKVVKLEFSHLRSQKKNQNYKTNLKIAAFLLSWDALTVVPNWESTNPHLCSKFLLFKMSWWILRVLPQLCPLKTSYQISESFLMRYCMTLYLNGYQKYDRSKLKVLFSLSELRSFNFDLLYFWSPFQYRVIQYLIGKLSDMIKMI